MSALLAKLFTDTDDSFTTRTYHTGLLWGLEAVAWSPEYFPRAADALIRLSEIDPGGRLTNRPMNSLISIFRPWFPQTSATFEARMLVLRSLVTRHPAEGRRLLMALLPGPIGGVATHNHLPRFRQWGHPPTAVPADYWDFMHEVVRLAFEMLQVLPEYWPKFLEHLPDLPATDRTETYSRLASLADAPQVNAEIKHEVWNALHEMARQHRAYSDSRWALPDADVSRIEEVAERIAPAGAVEQYKWLFDSQMPDTGTKRDVDFNAHLAELERLRVEAIRVIIASGGFEAVRRLIEESSESLIVGRTLADAWPETDVALPLTDLESSDKKRAGAAFGFALRRVEQEGVEWIDQQLPHLTMRPLAQARLLRTSTSFAEVWQRLDVLGADVEEAYWSEFVPYGLGDHAGLVSEIARRLLAHGRPGAAVDLLHLFVGTTDPPIEPELVANALNTMLDTGIVERVAPYTIQSVLDYLRSSAYDDAKLGILEWRVFPALGYGARSPQLERRLARDPSFFVEILSLVYRRRDGTTEQTVRPEVAQNAFHLLHEWRIVPGSSEREQPIDEGRLWDWLRDVRGLLKQTDREDIGLTEIGRVFAYAGEDPDGTWPCLAVRNAIERLADDNVDQGFKNGTYNKRGVVTRGLAEGGRQEYDLADRFHAWARQVGDEWHRTAALLRSIGDGYQIEGRREDEEARRYIEGLDR